MNILRRGTRTARRILDGLLVSLLVVVVLAVILGRVVPLTGRTTLLIGGGSMEPAIPLGAAVVIEPVDGSKLQVGDVVSLRSGPGIALPMNLLQLRYQGVVLDREKKNRQPLVTRACQRSCDSSYFLACRLG